MLSETGMFGIWAACSLASVRTAGLSARFNVNCKSCKCAIHHDSCGEIVFFLRPANRIAGFRQHAGVAKRGSRSRVIAFMEPDKSLVLGLIGFSVDVLGRNWYVWHLRRGLFSRCCAAGGLVCDGQRRLEYGKCRLPVILR